MIQGVTHNLGFGKAILANEAYATGNYSTAFIPTYFPKGYQGERLQRQDHEILSLASFALKEQSMERQGSKKLPKELFMEFQPMDKDESKVTYRVWPKSSTHFVAENIESGEQTEMMVDQMDLKANCLIDL